jgi:hypothetical protein
MTPTQALKDYEACLTALRDSEAVYAAKKSALVEKRKKIEAYLVQEVSGSLETVPEIVSEDRAFTAWLLKRKTDASAVEAHMQIDDVVMPRLKAAYDGETEELKSALEVLELWTLKRLSDSGLNNFSTDAGTASRTTVTYYRIADKALLAKDALDNGYASELTLSIPRNSKFLKGLLEERGELPAGVTMTQTYECRITKAKG